MVRIGLVGVGFMGWIHYLAYQQTPNVKLAAISTRDAKRLAGDWRGIQGNFGPPGEEVDLRSVAKYRDWREMLSDPEIDVVDICLPPYLHTEVAVAALGGRGCSSTDGSPRGTGRRSWIDVVILLRGQ